MKKSIFLTIYVVVSLLLVWGCAIFIEWDVFIARLTIGERLVISLVFVCFILGLVIILAFIEIDD
ncbi:hypothetical protein LCGC14_0536940 [marine sediment metagenome]|uniref:Uncharacterized protein n=1 Tax=marine sediment metagenome TaxID=412755 RepID=A0A0F9RYM9_9ZZZZ